MTGPESEQKGRRRGFVARLRDHTPAYVRIPVGMAFIAGAAFSFLPVLGVWMLPVGLAILAPSFPWAMRLQKRLLRRSLKYGLIRRRRNNDGDGRSG